MEHYQEDRHDQLKARIPADYRKNFEALAGQIAPDGIEIDLVGFTALREGREKAVAVTRQRITPPMSLDHELALKVAESKTGTVAVRGKLVFANSVRKGKTKTIKILPAEGEAVSVSVPAELMHDIVRPFYEAEVIATLAPKAKGGGFSLVDIVGV
jgi:hypothetical protein